MEALIAVLTERLYQCHLEMVSLNILKAATKAPPARRVDVAALPLGYAIPRAMATPIPLGGHPGAIRVARTFELQYPAFTAMQHSDDLTGGVIELQRAAEFLDSVIDYWAAHPRLHTAELPELRLISDVQYSDQGVIEFPLAGGGSAWGTVGNLLISVLVDNQGYEFS